MNVSKCCNRAGSRPLPVRRKVTACCSAIPYIKTTLRHFFHHNAEEHPLGIAGVIPIISGLERANSNNVCPKTSWNLTAVFPPAAHSLILFPVSTSNNPGACHAAWSFSAGGNPFPLIVNIWSKRGPFSFCSRLKVLTSCTTS